MLSGFNLLLLHRKENNMDNTDPNISYSEALAELERILAGLRAEQCDVDTLVERTRRAALLLSLCRRKLTRTEEELAKVLEELEN